jgi:chromosomal replication initiation ATPase DnaA
LRTIAGPIARDSQSAEARQLSGLDPELVMAAVADFYGVTPDLLSRRHEPHVAREVAAWLCRRHTEASLRELAPRLGLAGATSVPNLTRRLDAKLAQSPKLQRDLAEIAIRITRQPSSTAKPAGRPRQKNKNKR